MASGLFLLLDDIATLLDDVATMTKVATKKAAGVLGDDLALNAQQVAGINADRELPVVWAVAKGSVVNKAILVPAALLISAFAPMLIVPLLMLGGLFLCFEGVEKIAHRFLHSDHQDEQHHQAQLQAIQDQQVDLVDFEKDKIKGAVRTDFILSAEIIVIALGTVAGASLLQRSLTLVGISLLLTVGVYGLVALIVKIDDLGLYLSQRSATALQGLGKALLAFAPWLMRALSFFGTLAMFLVGGHILLEGWPSLHHWQQASGIPAPVVDLGLGLVAGSVVLAVVEAVRWLRR